MLTDGQKQERKSGIGGSDAAAICGLSKWKTPYGVYLEKLDLIDTSKDDYKEHLHFGSILEPLIIEEYVRRSGNEVERREGLLRHPKYEWMIANIDGYITNAKGILECKTSTAYKSQEWGESYTDHFPDEYLLQCAHYACVADVEFVDLAVLIGGNTFRMYQYKRNEALEKKLIEREREFWHDNILAQMPPEPINSDDASKLWKLSTGELITADQQIRSDIALLKEFNKDIKELETKKSETELRIKNVIKDAEGIADDFGNILLTWKNQNTNRFDQTAFKEENPELFKKFIKVSSTRVLRVRGTKDE